MRKTISEAMADTGSKTQKEGGRPWIRWRVDYCVNRSKDGWDGYR